MIKEALQYFRAMAIEAEEPKTMEINGLHYTVDDLEEVKEAHVESLDLDSLSGMVDYIKSNFDLSFHSQKLMIHIESPSKVVLMDSLKGGWKSRDVYCRSMFNLTGMQNGSRLSPEDFNMALQIHIEDKHDRSRLLKMSGTIGCEKSMTSFDDGVTQTVSTRKGAVLESSEQVPNPVILSPYRTFAEVEQPSSPYIFRVHDRGADQLPTLSLTECDGGKWKSIAVQTIKSYFNDKVPEITVLA